MRVCVWPRLRETIKNMYDKRWQWHCLALVLVHKRMSGDQCWPVGRMTSGKGVGHMLSTCSEAWRCKYSV